MTDPTTAVLQTELPGLKQRGKVRDLYDLGDALMLVASDRISAFDVVMDQPIPGKGVVLTRMSEFWLNTLPACTPHHLQYVVSEQQGPAAYAEQREMLTGRTMICRKAAVLPVECVVRGYLIGGGWREYQESGAVSGIDLPKRLQRAQQFPEPLFTPSTKATDGHDEPISFEQSCAIAEDFLQTQRAADPNAWTGGQAGAELMSAVRDRSIAIYKQASEHATARGLILADTKFEFGLAGGEILLVDEVLTPDSSRFWPADAWKVGENPPSFDKQFLRDYLESVDWNKQPPPPTLPDKILTQTAARYREAYDRLTK